MTFHHLSGSCISSISVLLKQPKCSRASHQQSSPVQSQSWLVKAVLGSLASTVQHRVKMAIKTSLLWCRDEELWNDRDYGAQWMERQSSSWSAALEWVGPLKTLGSRKILGDPESDGKAVSVQDPLSHRTVGRGISMFQRSSQTSVADSGCQVCPRTDKFWVQVRENFILFGLLTNGTGRSDLGLNILFGGTIVLNKVHGCFTFCIH